MQKEIKIEWQRLIELADQIRYGKVELVLKDGIPVRADVIIKQVKLDEPEEFKKGLDTIPLG